MPHSAIYEGGIRVAGMARESYSEADGEVDVQPGIIGQVSGPRSWSEYQTAELPDGSDCNFDRNNPTPLPTDVPDPQARYAR